MTGQQTALIKNMLLYRDCYYQMRSDMKDFAGDWVRSVRTSQNKSVRKFAAQIGIEPSYLSKIENGHLPLSPELAKVLIDILEVAA